ncbi:MAG TPA: hypothetical protein VNJ07_11650, partial [Chitinophagales bacterium]|nr:hypothetical protein [Chitinophagales bacterium]
SRDYAALSPLVISAGIFLTLLIQRRYAALAAFTLVVMPYLLRLDTSLGILFSKTDKFYCDLYYNPLHTWALHAILYVSGPAFFLFLAFIITYALYYLLRNAPSLNFKTISGWMKNDKAAVLLLAQIVLASLYIAGIAITTTRVARIAVLPLATVTGLALFLVYEILPLRKIILSKSFKVCSLFLILLSWIVMYHQLFVAFDGGKTYAYPAFDLERYNHPMYLRPLRGENDMHVCGVDSFPPCQPR